MEKLTVKSPATGKTVGTLKMESTTQVQAKIKKAHTAFDAWKALSAFDRAEILHKWAALIVKEKPRLAKLITAECGKLSAEAAAEVDYAASFITWSAESAKRIYGEVIPTQNNSHGLVVRQPIGVVAAITPWNFPAAMITRKTAPALATGCTVVVKPPLETPLTAIELEKLALKAGIPEGVFTTVVGQPKEIGKEFCENPFIRKLSFTGSTEVGKILAAQAGAHMKKVTMELGGNAPFIVFDDADIKKAVSGAVKSRFRYSGQTCICANRFLVQENIYDEFAKALAQEVKKLKLAPLINADAVKKVDKLLKTSNGKILCGGKYNGNFFEPTVLTNVKPDAEIFSTEIFGPVAALYKFKTTAEAIKLANNSIHGLAAYIYGADLKNALYVAENIEFGMIAINDTTLSTAFSPFGGVKQSGIGREGSHYGLEEYLDIKYINF